MRKLCGVNRGMCLTTGLASVLLAGCGGSPPPAPPLPDLMPVSGTVTMGEEPLADAIVLFIPTGQGEGFSGMGGTDEKGHYEVVTMYDGKANSGIPAGKYKVAVTKMVAPDGSPLPHDPETPPAMLGGREAIPPPYSSPAQSPLMAEVPTGGDTIDFKLKVRKR